MKDREQSTLWGEEGPAKGKQEDSGWFRKSSEDSGRVFKQELAFLFLSLGKTCHGADRKGYVPWLWCYQVAQVCCPAVVPDWCSAGGE